MHLLSFYRLGTKASRATGTTVKVPQGRTVLPGEGAFSQTNEVALNEKTGTTAALLIGIVARLETEAEVAGAEVVVEEVENLTDLLHLLAIIIMTMTMVLVAGSAYQIETVIGHLYVMDLTMIHIIVAIADLRMMLS
jgi:hypothetical protein